MESDFGGIHATGLVDGFISVADAKLIGSHQRDPSVESFDGRINLL